MITNRTVTTFTVVLLVSLLGSLHSKGSGWYGPTHYLERGGKNVVGTPEFYWELELKRLAQNYHPTEKLSKVPLVGNGGFDTSSDQTPLKMATASADIADFELALKNGEIKPTDAASAAQQHRAARDLIRATDDKSTGELESEFDSEFADYHKGAYAFARGKDHWDEAAKAWQRLLQRPASERHYRSVWAAFMLGKLALKNNDPEAIKWFQMTRDFAKNGYADSLGMAADSYGWEGRSHWKLGQPEKAAPLFLTQLALGDQSAIVSLKALIPDRTPIDFMLNYGIEADAFQARNEQQKIAADAEALQGLKVAAADPLLRKLVTAHILTTRAMADYYPESVAQYAKRSNRWLTVIDGLKMSAIDDAEYLGWLAYSTGNYQDAARWLKLAAANSPAACWLRAKLELRDGKVADAIKDMTLAVQSLKTSYSPHNNAEETDRRYVYSGEGGQWQFADCASGDLAGLHLTQGDFILSLDIFLKGGLWLDAAFIAESVITTDELKAYVDKSVRQSSTATDPENPFQKLRYLLGRRLVRDGRNAEAASYLPQPVAKVHARYAKALQESNNSKLPKSERAEAYFTAAWLTRHQGMELMGTEIFPDGFYSEGGFQGDDIAGERLTGKCLGWHDGKPLIIQLPIEVTKAERARIKANQIQPNVRYHYRFIAADLTIKSAALLNDNIEELADVLNTAGMWVKDRDEKRGDRYFSMIEKRCARTEIGKAAIAKRWFVDALGPWSKAQKAALDAIQQGGDARPSKP